MVYTWDQRTDFRFPLNESIKILPVESKFLFIHLPFALQLHWALPLVVQLLPVIQSVLFSLYFLLLDQFLSIFSLLSKVVIVLALEDVMLVLHLPLLIKLRNQKIPRWIPIILLSVFSDFFLFYFIVLVTIKELLLFDFFYAHLLTHRLKHSLSVNIVPGCHLFVDDLEHVFVLDFTVHFFLYLLFHLIHIMLIL